jgi:hypothetical protein
MGMLGWKPSYANANATFQLRKYLSKFVLQINATFAWRFKYINSTCVVAWRQLYIIPIPLHINWSYLIKINAIIQSNVPYVFHIYVCHICWLQGTILTLNMLLPNQAQASEVSNIVHENELAKEYGDRTHNILSQN